MVKSNSRAKKIKQNSKKDKNGLSKDTKRDTELMTSYWQLSAPQFTNNPLEKNVRSDVVIIGAGIAGLSIGYMLAKQGVKSVILEAQAIGYGETAKSTAHISDALDDRYKHLIKLFGIERAKLAYESHREALQTIKEIVKKEKIDCDLEEVPGYLFSDYHKELQREERAAQKVGNMVHFAETTLPFYTHALKFEKQAQFHPLKYLYGLAKAYARMGGTIYTQAKVIGMNFRKGFVTTDDCTIFGKHFVIATNTPINTILKVHVKQAPYTTYVNAYKIKKNSVQKALYWDTRDPYHYIRLQKLDKNTDLLIVGGEDSKTGQEKFPERRYKKLHDWVTARFPMCNKIAYSWSGQVMEPSDSLAYIGRISRRKNVYIVSGDSGNGITHATIAALIIPDLILRTPNKYEQLYSPKRAVRYSKELIEENVNVAEQFIKYLDKRKKYDVAIGEGAIQKRGSRLIAVYNDNGNMIKFSAACTHLGCPLEWNPLEKTFDCTCHGSRFTAKGDVIHGPAIKGLKRLK